MRLEDKPRTLWIDAICIDQNSLSERSQQVAIMMKIYEKASRNLIYLGEDDGSAQAGLRAIRSVVSDMKSATGSLRMLRETLYDIETGASNYCVNGFDESVDFPALETLFDLPWFR